MQERRLYGAISGVYAVSRLALYLLGARFHAGYDWQHFHDVKLLKERLWESLLYTHSFTPFMSMLAGVVLKCSEQHAPLIYQTLYFALGLLFVNAMGYLMARFGTRNSLILAVVTLFSLSPAFIYLERFLHYEFLAAALLAVSAVLFHRALLQGSFRRWLACFLVCALIAYVRTSFHLVWLLFVVLLACLFQYQRWRTVLTAALLPVALVIAFYAKNQVLFGFFGSSSWVGFNLAIVTTNQLTGKQRRAWIKAHKLHPVSAVPLYSAPQAYAAYVDLDRKRGIPVLDQELRANGQPNFNHWSYIEVSKLRQRDARYYLSHRKRQYFATVREGLTDYMRPTSRWHPADPKGSPHRQNRAVIGRWEDLYNHLFHDFPRAPKGVYPVLFLLIALSVARSAWVVLRAKLRDASEDKMVLLLAFHALYVPALSVLVTIGELERYRFMVEAFMWILGIHFTTRVLRRLWAGRALQPTTANQSAPTQIGAV